VGDERWSDLIVKHFGELERIALSHDGVVVKTLGDGAMFAFGSAYGAVRASLAIREMSLAVGAGTRAVAIRLGLNTGEAIATDTDFFGQAVNIAARLAGAAEAGQILASETVRTLVGDRNDIAFGPPLSVTLKGIPDVKRAFPVDRRPEPAP
jgi:class 3 adenylate cyclase